MCERRGLVVSAKDVDHIVSIASGGDAFPTLAGLMALCHSCHSIKTQAMDRTGGKGIAFKGCGIDGLPLDPLHPFTAGDTPSEDEQLTTKGPSWVILSHLVQRGIF
jgi:hypothetical protein